MRLKLDRKPKKSGGYEDTYFTICPKSKSEKPYVAYVSPVVYIGGPSEAYRCINKDELSELYEEVEVGGEAYPVEFRETLIEELEEGSIKDVAKDAPGLLFLTYLYRVYRKGKSEVEKLPKSVAILIGPEEVKGDLERVLRIMKKRREVELYEKTIAKRLLEILSEDKTLYKPLIEVLSNYPKVIEGGELRVYEALRYLSGISERSEEIERFEEYLRKKLREIVRRAIEENKVREYADVIRYFLEHKSLEIEKPRHLIALVKEGLEGFVASRETIIDAILESDEPRVRERLLERIESFSDEEVKKILEKFLEAGYIEECYKVIEKLGKVLINPQLSSRRPSLR